MPRHLPIRPAKIIGNLFVLIVLSYIASVYYIYVFILWGPQAESKFIHNSRILASPDRSCILPHIIHHVVVVVFPVNADRPRTSARVLGLPPRRL